MSWMEQAVEELRSMALTYETTKRLQQQQEIAEINLRKQMSEIAGRLSLDDRIVIPINDLKFAVLEMADAKVVGVRFEETVNGLIKRLQESCRHDPS